MFDSQVLLQKLVYYIAAILVGCFVAKLIGNDRKRTQGKVRGAKEKHERRSEQESTTEDEDIEVIDTRELQSNPEADVEHIPYVYTGVSETEMLKRTELFYQRMNERRSIRFIDKRPVPRQVMENLLKTAGTAPSGANQQPYFFCVVESADVKSQLREIVEHEEELNYKRRMGPKWVEDLRPFRTNWVKPYIDDAPYLIAVFKKTHEVGQDGERKAIYYGEIGCCIAVGFLLAAIHNAGLVTVTTTPLNCGPAIRKLLDRPPHEKLVFLLPIGYPAADATVPNIGRKLPQEIMTFI